MTCIGGGNLAIRLYNYFRRQQLYKKRLRKTLYELRPDITISTLRREINFITSIRDGSRKIGEFHFSRDNYRNFNDIKAPASIRRMACPHVDETTIGYTQKIGKVRCTDQ